jgi:hypothetical protein
MMQPKDAVTTEDLQQFKELLELVPESKETSHKTFFEICDVSSRELSYSSFLAFFLDPRREHGFGDLFLKSLVEVSGKALNTSDVRSIEREVPTDEGRIDLVIEGDSFVIGIENKIGAPVSNDLQDYSRYLEKRAREGDRKKLAILLSIKKEQTAHGFTPVLYQTLAAEIKKNLGQTLPHADPRSITYLLDFITSIDHLEKGTYMDNALLRFFQENEKSSVRLHQKTQELVGMMREKVKQVAEKVQFPSRFEKRIFWATLTNGDSTETLIYDVVSSNVKISERLTCYAEAVFFLNKGWMIVVALEQGQSVADLGKWLKDNGIKLNEKSPVPDKRWVYAEFPFEESEESVAAKYQELLVKIAARIKNKPTR